jgi:hypothetical protein
MIGVSSLFGNRSPATGDFSKEASMAIARGTVVKLLSVNEYRLYEASRQGRVDDHGATRLRSMIAATRKLQDKYRARAKQQKGEVRGKRAQRSGRSAEGADNTRRKQEIFTDVLQRLEAALDRAQARPDPERPKGRAADRRRGDKGQRARAARKKTATKKKGTAKKKTATKEKGASKKKSTAKKKVATKGKGASKKKVATKKKSTAKKKVATKRNAAAKGKAAPKKKSAAKRRTAAKRASKKATSAQARSAQAPKGSKRARKGQASAARTRMAHSAARGRRRQARRDR